MHVCSHSLIDAMAALALIITLIVLQDQSAIHPADAICKALAQLQAPAAKRRISLWRCIQEMKSKAQAIRRGALMVSDLLPGNDNAWLRMTRTMLAIQEAITSTLQPTPDRVEAHILIQNRTQYNQYLRTRSLKNKAHMSKPKKDKRRKKLAERQLAAENFARAAKLNREQQRISTSCIAVGGREGGALGMTAVGWGCIDHALSGSQFLGAMDHDLSCFGGRIG